MKKIVSIMLIFAMMTVTVSCSKNDNKSEKNIVPDKETTIESVDMDGNNIEFVARGDYFYHNDNKKWNRVILKGVNMGLTLATTNLNNPDVSYETYMEWFEQINECKYSESIYNNESGFLSGILRLQQKSRKPVISYSGNMV